MLQILSWPRTPFSVKCLHFHEHCLHLVHFLTDITVTNSRIGPIHSAFGILSASLSVYILGDLSWRFNHVAGIFSPCHCQLLARTWHAALVKGFWTMLSAFELQTRTPLMNRWPAKAGTKVSSRFTEVFSLTRPRTRPCGLKAFDRGCAVRCSTMWYGAVILLLTNHKVELQNAAIKLTVPYNC